MGTSQSKKEKEGEKGESSTFDLSVNSYGEPNQVCVFACVLYACVQS